VFDLDWIVLQFAPGNREKPMTVVSGLKGESRVKLMEEAESYPHISVTHVGKNTPMIHIKNPT